MPFIIFKTERNETVNLTFDIKVLQPDNTFSIKDEYNDMRIAQRGVPRRIYFRSDALVSYFFPGSEYTVGKYQFHITIKENGNAIFICVLEFELLEE